MTVAGGDERDSEYEVPELMVLGTMAEFLLGSGSDTAELKTHYW